MSHLIHDVTTNVITRRELTPAEIATRTMLHQQEETAEAARRQREQAAQAKLDAARTADTGNDLGLDTLGLDDAKTIAALKDIVEKLARKVIRLEQEIADLRGAA